MSGASPKLSDNQVATIVALRESGHTYSHIARSVGCTLSAARYHCLQHGAERPGKSRIIAAPEVARTFNRGGKDVRQYSQEDDALLRALRMQGLSMPRIARRMRRTYSSVRGRLITIARHDMLQEDAA